jgi:hypothetical protein
MNREPQRWRHVVLLIHAKGEILFGQAVIIPAYLSDLQLARLRVLATGGFNKRLSRTALIAVQAGQWLRLVFRVQD